MLFNSKPYEVGLHENLNWEADVEGEHLSVRHLSLLPTVEWGASEPADQDNQ